MALEMAGNGDWEVVVNLPAPLWAVILFETSPDP
jgi:hypothetical protein